MRASSSRALARTAPRWLRQRLRISATCASPIEAGSAAFAAWRRLRNHFQGPPANNPKLISYLAAGSIQGLRPMRYEKRVARNRVLILAVILVFVLWGTLAVILKR